MKFAQQCYCEMAGRKMRTLHNIATINRKHWIRDKHDILVVFTATVVFFYYNSIPGGKSDFTIFLPTIPNQLMIPGLNSVMLSYSKSLGTVL